MPDPHATGSRADKFPSGPGDGGNSAPGWMPTPHSAAALVYWCDTKEQAAVRADLDRYVPLYVAAKREYDRARSEMNRLRVIHDAMRALVEQP